MDYLNLQKIIEENEELDYILNHFSGFRKNPTLENLKKWSKERLQKERELIENKTSKLSKRERDFVIYLCEK